MKFIKLFIIVLLSLLSSIISCQREDLFTFAKNGGPHTWKYTGTAGISIGAASYVSIAVYNDKPYVAYIDGGDGNKPKLATYNGTAWTTIDVDTAPSTDISIAMNGSEPNIMYTKSIGTFVKKYTGGSFTNVGSVAMAGPPVTFSKIITVSGVPYAGYYNGSYTFVQRYNSGTDLWEVCGGSIGATSQMYISIAADDSYFYASFKETGTPKLAVYKGNIAGMPSSPSWTSITPSPTITADYISSVMYSGLPVVAYRDGNNSNKATVISYDGISAWNTLGTAGFSDGSVSNVSMTIFEGVPHVAFTDESTPAFQLTVMRFEGGSWVVDDIPRFTSSTVTSVSLAGGIHKMFAAFSETGTGGKLSVMEY